MDDSPHILFLDDNPDDRARVIRELERTFPQLRMTQISDRAQFEQALAADDVDLVITEYALSWTDGIAVVRQVKSRNPAVPVVMYTNSGTQEIAVEAVKAGADDYVVKSAQQLSRLAQAVRDALEQATIRRQAQAQQERTREALGALVEMAQILVAAPADRAVPGEPVVDVVEAEHVATRSTALRLSELTLRVVGCRRVGIHAVDQEAGVVQALAVVGFTPEQEAHWFERYRTPVLLTNQLGFEVPARLAAGEVVLLDYSRPPLSNLTNAYGGTTLLIAPMSVAGRLIGTLTLDYAGEAHTFTLDEVALAGAVAQLTALVIQRERLLRERAEARAQVLALDRSNRRMDEFLGIASHELKTPLTSIKANIQMLVRRAGQAFRGEAPARLSPAQRLDLLRDLPDLLDRTQRSVARLERLVGDLLDVSRISAGKLPLLLEPADLAVVVTEAVREQRESFPERVIRLALPERLVSIVVDPAMLVQAVSNIIGNAAKYSRADRPIDVMVRVEPGKPSGGEQQRGQMPPLVGWVGVRDEGPGLDAMHQQSVWERFYRADVAHQSGSGVGLGLGLYITREIVERHGGAVGVTSALGAGSTFWLTLPLTDTTPS